MRHIIAVAVIVLAGWAVYFMISLDMESDRFVQIQDIVNKSKLEVPLKKTVQYTQQSGNADSKKAAQTEKEDDEAAKKLKALRDRAGNTMAFKVSPLYKRRCSSCHGVNGEGIIGPKLVGLSRDRVYKALSEFKSGERKNYVMYGLLSKMENKDIEALSDEISTFQAKLEAAGN